MATATKHNQRMLKTELIGLYRKALRSGVSLQSIESKIDRHINRLQTAQRVEKTEDVVRIQQVKRRLPMVVRVGALIVPLLFLGVGFYLVGSAVVPILGYYVQGETDVQTHTLISPIPKDQVMDVMPLVIDAQQENKSLIAEVEIIDTELDYTNLNNWFDLDALAEVALPEVGSEITEYVIDIPKLNIANAVVKVGGVDLNESLIAYKGTALPGKPGAPVVFGHSVLRQFYNPSEKNPRRYNSIFSTIMTLKTGDPIYVTVKGVRYTYTVNNKTEVKPEDVYILIQKYDSKQLKLVTCTPEGTYLRRGVVTAQLVE